MFNYLGAGLKYTEFLSAAKKHNLTCKTLQEKIEAYKDDDDYTEEFEFLVANLYYLSGYIIECSLKFKIFEVSGYASNIDISQEKCLDHNINFNKRIKTHDFKKLQNYLDSKVPDISHTSDDLAIAALLKEWNPEVRYKHTQLEYLDVKSFHAHSRDFLKKM